MYDRLERDSRIGPLLEAAWQAGGTSLLLTVGMAPQIRVDGELVPVGSAIPLEADDTDAILRELLSGRPESSWSGSDYDFAFSWRNELRIRASVYRQRGYIALALRMIPRRIPTLSELRMPPILTEFSRLHQGLVLVTGPTGSGKTTTLAAMVDQINRERACHVVTIEDPIEYVHDHDRAMVNQREIGADTPSFPDALRAALRSDPDVLLIGEMRDLDSIASALTIAETGHLVLTTLHTNDAAQAVSRITDVFPAEQQDQIRLQLAAALSGIVYQRLIPRRGGGLVAAHEVLVATGAVRNLIKEGKTHQLRNSILTGQREGMVSFEKSLSALVQAGIVTYEEAAARSLHPQDIEASAGRVGVRA